MTDAPKLTVGEISAFCEKAGIRRPGLGTVESAALAEALAAFLRARVPPITELYEGGSPYDRGFNACRDQVLKGRE